MVSMNINWPHWVLQIKQYLPVCPQFILSGNTKDIHLIPTTDGVLFCSTVESLWEGLKLWDIDALLVYDRVDGITAFPESSRELVAAKLRGVNSPRNIFEPISLDGLAKVLRMVTTCSELRIAFVVSYASRLVSHGVDLSDPEHDFFAACQKLADVAQELRPPTSLKGFPYNPIFWIVDRPNDLPEWFTIGGERIKSVPIEMPNREVRGHASKRLVRDLKGAATLKAEDFAATSERFVDLTEGFTLAAMTQIRSIALAQGIEAAQISDAVRCFKVGIPDNPWRQSHLRERLANGEARINHSIKGQAAAVQRTLDILKRSVMGLSGAQASSSPSRPRGILFFAGPTGVGKTELAKAITRLIFGNEQAYIRFDMSEFSSEHSEARLIGAPPGYVGFDGGGELVNAVRSRPFCVILFDEIEKAHPRILDKFLQILEDGRLTDGRGRTVHFSESVIIFTSNLGMYVLDESGTRTQNVTIENSYSEVVSRIHNAISEHFRFELQRPELLNRIGDNIVVFDFIRKSVANEIFEKMLSNIVTRVEDEHGLKLVFSENALSALRERCTSDLVNGGRGIGNRLESLLINPLSRELFQHGHKGEVLVKSVLLSNGVVSLQLS